MFLKTDFLKKFANFTGKHLCWSLFLRKLQAFWRATLLETITMVFSCEICEIVKNTFFAQRLRQLLLSGYPMELIRVGIIVPWLSLIKLYARKDVVNEIKVFGRHKPLKSALSCFIIILYSEIFSNSPDQIRNSPPPFIKFYHSDLDSYYIFLTVSTNSTKNRQFQFQKPKNGMNENIRDIK